MTILELTQRRDECTDPSLRDGIDRLLRAWVQRQINPPLIVRRSCRYCGQPMPDVMQIACRANGDGYAHVGCVERERSTTGRTPEPGGDDV